MSHVFPARDVEHGSQLLLKALNPFNTPSITPPEELFYGLA
jgi:hypothetical protein